MIYSAVTFAKYVLPVPLSPTINIGSPLSGYDIATIA
jgi:hypothetical protein